ncbi:Chaperone protein dnaJ 72 [Forsythia ovata]|uniref:Chaperone protein dnaJ 72 n=1 Tax=Forsythia ovata TaxID=205694 RepID=A0ABD1SN60_9LAMI
MDHYKVLGLHKNASKEEIKQAFRKLAMQFHPDKHSHSPQHLKDSATLKFKQLSEAYDTLIDDRKRADYNLRRNSQSTGYKYENYRNRGSGSNYSNFYGHRYGYGYSGNAYRGAGDSVSTKFEIFLRFLTTRSFLLNAAFVGVLLGGTFVVDAGGKALWEMHNPGKSFEEAIESIEKAKTSKDDS